MEERKPTKPDWHGKVLLVVEDEDHNYAYIHEILKRTHATIIRADNGIMAVDIVRKKIIDLILMDIKLPEMDGYKATVEIKKIKPLLPIIAQTAFAMEKERIACLKAGCDDYIAKPYEPLKLLERIMHFMKS
ncbi:MAG: response regulator [Bacteroidales bacterium]|nr:response regulator [Bacteroidales bacterium]